MMKMVLKFLITGAIVMQLKVIVVYTLTKLLRLLKLLVISFTLVLQNTTLTCNFIFYIELRNSENCPCTRLTQCKWSSDLLMIMKTLDKSHPDWIKAKETMKNNFCRRRKPRKVNCCSLMSIPRNIYANGTLYKYVRKNHELNIPHCTERI